MYCNNCGYNNDDQASFCGSCGAKLQSMTEETAIQPSLTTTNLNYAGLLRRFGAAVIDCILLYSAVMLLYLLLVIIAGTINADLSLSIQWTIVVYGLMLIFILALAYFAIMESSSKQATLGKMALGITVTDHTGNRVSFLRAALRVIIKVISGAPYGILLLVSCFTIVFTRENKALHDMIAGTRVVMKS